MQNSNYAYVERACGSTKVQQTFCPVTDESECFEELELVINPFNSLIRTKYSLEIALNRGHSKS